VIFAHQNLTSYGLTYLRHAVQISDRTNLSTESGSGPIQLARARYRIARRSVAESLPHCMNARQRTLQATPTVDPLSAVIPVRLGSVRLPGTLLTSVGGEGTGVIKSRRCHSPATSSTEVVTSLRVPVANRFSLNGYRLWKKSSFYILTVNNVTSSKRTTCQITQMQL